MLKTTLCSLFTEGASVFFYLLINNTDSLLPDEEMSSKRRSGARDLTQLDILLYQSRIRIEVQVGVLVRIPDKSSPSLRKNHAQTGSDSL
jgi:hypothetical protein